MAEDKDQDKSKTEDPTQRKLDDAHKKGQVVKSQEVNNLAMIAAATLVVAVFSGPVMTDLAMQLRTYIESPHDIALDPVATGLHLKTLGASLARTLAAPLAILYAAALFANLVQHKPVFTGEKLKPKWSHINPWNGSRSSRFEP